MALITKLGPLSFPVKDTNAEMVACVAAGGRQREKSQSLSLQESPEAGWVSSGSGSKVLGHCRARAPLSLHQVFGSHWRPQGRDDSLENMSQNESVLIVAQSIFLWLPGVAW